MTTWTMRFNGELIGKERPRFGKGRVHTAETTRSAESDLKYGMRQGWPGPPLDGPVAVRVVVFVSPPASWAKSKRASSLGQPAICKPDIDNAIKLILDSGNKILWGDDNQVAALSAKRIYGVKSMVLLTVTPIEALTLRASSATSCETIVDTDD